VALFAIGLVVVLREGSSGQRVHAEGADKVLRMPLFVEGIDASSRDGLAASRTERSSLRVVVNLAVRLASVFEKGSVDKGLLAVLADKVLGVPLRAKSVDAVSSDGLRARSALGSKDCVKVGLAIGSAVFFKEISRSKGLQALSADEVFRMPLLSQRGDASIQNGFVAVRALGAVEFLIASIAVRNSIVRIKVSGSERFVAVSADKVFGMISLTHGLNDLSQDGLSAAAAGASRCGVVHRDVAHLVGKIGQEIVELVCCNDLGWSWIVANGRIDCRSRRCGCRSGSRSR